MNAQQALAPFKQVLGYVGLALAVVALAKFFGVDIPIRGDAQTTALVAIACLLAR